MPELTLDALYKRKQKLTAQYTVARARRLAHVRLMDAITALSEAYKETDILPPDLLETLTNIFNFCQEKQQKLYALEYDANNRLEDTEAKIRVRAEE